MLSIPSGFRRSISAHNIDVSTFLDWIEATVLIDERELSPTDIVECLIEEQLYENQDFASEYVSAGWADVKTRLSTLGHQSPIKFRDRWMIRSMNWKEVPAYSFCLVVSFGPQYDDWDTCFGPDYTEQGDLFELLTKAAMKKRFIGWKFLHTGWNKKTTTKLTDVIGDIVTHIGERVGDIAEYASDQANEAGVDLMWHLPFVDNRGGIPVFLAQCASGKNWVSKVHEPDMKVWKKMVNFAAYPSKAFSLPYDLSEKELRKQSTRAGGLLLDRYRLLTHRESEDNWVPSSLQQCLIDWLEPRIDWIERR